jgi:predicted RNase H-like nuclease
VRALVATRREQAGDPAQVKGLSAQAAGILPKICELDAFLREDATRNGVLAECHPEVSFTVMNGGVPLPGKSSAAGQLARVDLVREAFPDAEAVIRASPLSLRHGLVDILDAYAALWSALRWGRGDHETLGDGSHDALTGAPMRMVA